MGRVRPHGGRDRSWRSGDRGPRSPGRTGGRVALDLARSDPHPHRVGSRSRAPRPGGEPPAAGAPRSEPASRTPRPPGRPGARTRSPVRATRASPYAVSTKSSSAGSARATARTRSLPGPPTRGPSWPARAHDVWWAGGPSAFRLEAVRGGTDEGWTLLRMT